VSDFEELRPGASNPELDAEMYGLSGVQAARLAERILATPEVEIAQRGVDLTRAHAVVRARKSRGNDGHPLQGLDRGRDA